MPYKLRTITCRCGHQNTWRMSEETAYKRSQQLCSACWFAYGRAEARQQGADEWADAAGEGSWDGEYFTDGFGEEHHVSDA